MNVKPNLIADKTFEFALMIVALVQRLRVQKEYVLANQLMKSGTSIGANVEEAIAAQSRKDFINKMSIAAKEARETRYWLRLIDRANIADDIHNYLNDIEHIINILTKIVLTTQQSTTTK